jgi:enoyl-CoA hydratase/carnithine racemase
MWNKFLDEVESTPGPATLVTINTRKTYSAGFQVDLLIGKIGHGALMTQQGLALFSRIMTLNLPTLAVCNGNVIAGGLLIALAHDKVIMLD